MGIIPPQDLLNKWQREEITVEMAIGHILQNLTKVQIAIDAINLTLYNLRAMVDSLIAHTEIMPNPKGKKKPP